MMMIAFIITLGEIMQILRLELSRLCVFLVIF